MRRPHIRSVGATENAGVENAVRAKMQGWKMREQVAWAIYQRLENAGAYFVGELSNIFDGFILISMIFHTFTVLKKFSGCTKFGLLNR